MSIIGAAMIAALIGILSPSGERGGIAAHVRLLCALFLVCVIISPIKDVLEKVRGWANGDTPFFEEDGGNKGEYEDIFKGASDDASKRYIAEMLTRSIEEKFSLESGTVRVAINWNEGKDTLTPRRVTVILSGKSIWQDPRKIEGFVTSLLGCECAVAIE